MSDHSNSNKSGLKLLAGILATAVSVTVFLGLGVFGFALVLASLNPADPDAAPVEPVVAVAPAVAAAPGSPATPAAPPVDPALLASGKTTYSTLCIACHGPDAKGMPNNMAPALAGSEIVNGPTERLAMIVLNGIQPEGRFTGVMVSWKPLLDDEKIAGVLTYLRSNFGNSAPAISPDQIAWARDKHKDVAGFFTRADLEKVTDDLPAGQ